MSSITDIHAIAQLIRFYVLSLERDGVDDPLGQSFNLAAVLADLLALAGASVPVEIAGRLEESEPVVTTTDGAGEMVFTYQWRS